MEIYANTPTYTHNMHSTMGQNCKAIPIRVLLGLHKLQNHNVRAKLSPQDTLYFCATPKNFEI